MNKYVVPALFVVVAAAILGASGYLYYLYYATPRCEVCGMLITPEMERNIVLTDVDTGRRIWTCCPGCMLRSVAAHPNVNIDVLDSWYGSSAETIHIEIRNGSVVSVSPESTRILLGSKIVPSCANNRIAINETSAELLRAHGWNPENPLSVFKNELPEGTPALTVAAALEGLKAKGISYQPPSMVFVGGIALVGVVILATGILAWRKLAAPVKATPKTPN
ncbi:MAG: hypothetical protein QFX35_03220 [Candidatus Verstraetearchaeota archaeon]|nr:hypothetical protein [Candidatus Verstraetearchaeota archaeon]